MGAAWRSFKPPAGLGMFFMPRPRWLAKHGHVEAREISSSSQFPNIESEFQEIQGTLSEANQRGVGLIS
jgi:hypothetical protein